MCRCGDFSKSGEELLTSGMISHPFLESLEKWKPLRCLSSYYVCGYTDSWPLAGMTPAWKTYMHFFKGFTAANTVLAYMLHYCFKHVHPQSAGIPPIFYHMLSVYVHMYAHIPLPFICTCI